MINEVISIVEKNNPKYLRLHSLQRLQLEDQQQMKLLKMRAAAYPLTKRVQELREKECKCAGAIFSHMLSAESIDIEKMRSPVIITMHTVSRFLAGLRKNNESVSMKLFISFWRILSNIPRCMMLFLR